MRIYLCGTWDADEAKTWHECLQAAMPDEHWLTDLAGMSTAERATVELAVVANPSPGSLQLLPGLKLIQSLWAGVDRLLADPSLPHDVPLARMVDPAMNAAMAQTALWAVLSLHRDFFCYGRQQQRAQWQAWPQRRADDMGVLVLGVGQMGSEVALGLQRVGYRVQAWRRRPGATVTAVPVAHGEAALPGLLAQADVLINLLPLTSQTTGLLNAALFVQLPRGAAVVNLARGAHLVEADLLSALDQGQLGHAVLDVFSTEPLPADHLFWSHPQITVLPHVAAQTDPRSAAQVVARQLQALRSGLPLQYLVERDRCY
jgi:glyoxylate/hydroxypyruvate reductase A